MRAALQHAAQVSTQQPPPHSMIQMKARIGPVDDPLEREADQVADAVVADRPIGPMGRAASKQAQRKCTECAEEEEEATLQTKSVANRADRPAEAPAIVDDVLRSPGEPFDPATRSYFEPRFGRDFGGVRVHADGTAAKSADALNARAYTLRNHIVFGAGQFAPVSAAGKHLIAHELGHTIQQLHGGMPVIRRRPNAPPGEETEKVGVVAITTHQGSKRGQARLSDGTTVEIEVVNNALPVGDHTFTPVGSTKGRTLQGNDEFMWRIPSDPITQELFDRLEPVVAVTVQPSVRGQFQELSPVTRELVTSPAAGRKASAEDIANAALAGQVLESNLTPDELLLLEVRRRESKLAGESVATVGDPLEFAFAVVEARESAKLAAADNWSLLVLIAKMLAKEPIYIIERGGLGGVLNPGSYDQKKALFPGLVHFHMPGVNFTKWEQIEAAGKPLFEGFQTILNRFEDTLVIDLRNLAVIALDSAEASILRMDRQYAGIWQAKVWSPHYFWREVDKIKKDVTVSAAASERDRIKQQVDREQDEDRLRTMLNPVGSVIGQPNTYSERTEAREKEKERQDQIFNETVAQRSSLKVTQGFSAATILAATTADEAVGRLRDFLWDGRQRIIGAREKIKDRKILYAADKIIEAEKAELKDPLGSDASSINMVIDAFAKYRKSQTSLWEDILKIIEFVAMFVPGPIGWGLRFGTTVLGFDRKMKDIAARRDLHGANLRTQGVGSGEVGSAVLEAGINIVTDVPVAKAASAERRLTTELGRVGREGSEDVGRIAAHGEGVKPSTVGGDVPGGAPKTPVESPLPAELAPAPAGKAPQPPSPLPPPPKPDLGVPTYGNLPGRTPTGGQRVQIVEENGRYFEVDPETGVLSPASGDYSFARMPDGSLWGSRYGHAEASMGQRVGYAGQMKMENGALKSWSPQSGTYKPAGGEFAEQAGFPIPPQPIPPHAGKRVQLPVFQPQTRPPQPSAPKSPVPTGEIDEPGWREFLPEAKRRAEESRARYPHAYTSGAVMMSQSADRQLINMLGAKRELTNIEMQNYVEALMRDNPVLDQLARAQGLSGIAQRTEMIVILERFSKETGIVIEIVDDGVVQALRTPGDFASLGTAPGRLQIERSAWASTDQMAMEVRHALADYYSGIVGKAPVVQSYAFTALDALEDTIRNGGGYRL